MADARASLIAQLSTVTKGIGDRAFLLAVVVVLLLVIFVMFRALQRRNEKLRLKDEELELYRGAMEAHAMVSIVDGDGVISYVNGTLARATGYLGDELIGRAFNEVLLDDKVGSFGALWSKVQTGQMWADETRLRCKDGSTLWTKATIVPLMDPSGKLARAIWLRTDIRESRLSQADMQNRAMIDLLQDEVYVLTTDTLELIYLNKRSLAAMGWTAQEMDGRGLADIGSRFDVSMFRDRASDLLSGEIDSVLYEDMISTGPIEVSVQLDHSIEGVPRFVAMVRDISERKKAERDKKEFVSTVSHELRSPLTSIKGSLNLISSGALGAIPERSARLIQVALSNVDRLVRLINDLLDLEKLDANMMDFTFETIDLVAFADEAVAANAGYGHEYGVSLRRVGASGPVYAKVSRDGMMQVLTNLLSNAVKFSPQGQAVDLGVEETAEGARLTVTDRGDGIPPEAQGTLFTRFVQAHTQVDARRGGTGLGLSIAKSIMDKHEGKITFTSEMGAGTTFIIDLPKAGNMRAVA